MPKKPERLIAEGATPGPATIENQRVARLAKAKAKRRAAAKKGAETRARNRSAKSG